MRFLSLPLAVLAAVLAAAAVAPAAANAATVSSENGAIVFRGEGAEGNSLLVSSRPADYADPNGPLVLAFSDSGADRMVVTSGPCAVRPEEPTQIMCPMSDTPVVIEGSSAKDSLSIFSSNDVPDSIPFTIRGNGGDDAIEDAYDGRAGRVLEGGPGHDTIKGYAGNDRVDGGDGSDSVDGGEGHDTVLGGAGDDVLWGDHYSSPGADLLDGGPGTDQVDEWTIPGGDVHPLASVSLNGAADDGRPGEGDNVVGVEKFTFHINTTFSGSDAPESIEIRNVDEGVSVIDGGGGNDVIKAWDTNDTVSGGAGDDRVEGGLGNDVVTGGPGQDMLMGDSSASTCGFYSCKIPFGNDTVNAVDGEADQIDCGIGEDVAHVDALDTVTNCETVNRGATAPAGPGGGTKGAASGVTLTFAGSAKLRTLLGGRLAVKVPCAAACRVTVTATRGRRTVATGKATLLKAGTVSVKLKAGKQGRRALKGARRAKLTVRATIRAADGKPVTLSRALTLKA